MKLDNKEPKEIVASIKKNLPKYTLPETIDTMEEYMVATDLGSKIAKAKKDVEKFRDHFAKPHYDTYKKIREMFSPFVEGLTTKEKELKTLMLSFHKIEKVKRDAEQALVEAEAIANAPEGAEVVVEVVNDINTIDGGEGRSQVRTLKKWRVVDINKVPTKYLEVSKKLVDEDIKKGIVPPGIEQYEDQTLVFSR